jgi:hypothetical protein
MLLLYAAPPKVDHPFHIDEWRKYLKNCPPGPDGQIAIVCIESGYSLGLKSDFDPKRLCKRVHNFVRTKNDAKCMLERLLKELKKGQIIPGSGLYQLNLLCVPKKDGATGLMTGVRVARHGSYSFGKTVAINDGVTDEARSMKLPGFFDYVRRLEPYAYASLRDLKDAFRQLLLALSDQEFIQYSLFGLTFRDLRVAYGEAGAAASCQEFSMLIIWICENELPEFKERLNRLSVHIDDFLVVALDHSECKLLTAALDRLLKELGVAVSVEKNEDCIQRGVVHGFGFALDKSPRTVFVPADKAANIVLACIIILNCHHATGEALESLIGKIMHWCKFKKQAKSFCNRGIRRIHQHLRKNVKKHDKPYMILYIDEVWRADFALFLRFFLLFREVTMASLIYEPSIVITASTDASSTGGGFVCADRIYGYLFSDEPNAVGRVHKDLHINVQEAHAVIMMLYHCRHQLTGRSLWLLVDNTTVMYGVINAWSPSALLMEFLQEIALLSMFYCIDIRVDYIPTEVNLFSDWLSRQVPTAQVCELMGLFGVSADIQTDVEYYDQLRMMNAPIQLPDWLHEMDVDINSTDIDPTKIAKRLLRMFSKDFEPDE